jgi:hypothetical protein
MRTHPHPPIELKLHPYPTHTRGYGRVRVRVRVRVPNAVLWGLARSRPGSILAAALSGLGAQKQRTSIHSFPSTPTLHANHWHVPGHSSTNSRLSRSSAADPPLPRAVFPRIEFHCDCLGSNCLPMITWLVLLSRIEMRWNWNIMFGYSTPGRSMIEMSGA